MRQSVSVYECVHARGLGPRWGELTSQFGPREKAALASYPLPWRKLDTSGGGGEEDRAFSLSWAGETPGFSSAGCAPQLCDVLGMSGPRARSPGWRALGTA